MPVPLPSTHTRTDLSLSTFGRGFFPCYFLNWKKVKECFYEGKSQVVGEEKSRKGKGARTGSCFQPPMRGEFRGRQGCSRGIWGALGLSKTIWEETIPPHCPNPCQTLLRHPGVGTECTQRQCPWQGPGDSHTVQWVFSKQLRKQCAQTRDTNRQKEDVSHTFECLLEITGGTDKGGGRFRYS